ERVAIFTEWLVYATIALAFVALFQVWATLRSAKIQNRAYVVFERGDILNVANPLQGQVPGPPAGVNPAAINFPNLGPISGLHTKNSGKTPAYEVDVWVNMVLREYPLQAPLPERPDGLPPVWTVIGPEIVTTQNRNIPHPLAPNEIAALRASTMAVYVYGH